MKILSIQKSADFKKISSSPHKFYSQTILLLTKESPSSYSYDVSKGNNALEFCRVGFTVSKMISKLAVKRNFAKRRLREAFKELSKNHAKKSYDYVIIARKEILDAPYAKILTDLKFCLKRIHQNNNSKKS